MKGGVGLHVFPHVCLAIALLVTSSGCSPSASQPAQGVAGPKDSRGHATDLVFARVIRPGDPGLAVGVFQGGKPLYKSGFGLANLEHSIPVTPQTMFMVASISKQFTAFAIAQLAREGKVDLDADVRTYLPYVPKLGARIIVRNLIHHTGGLRDDLPELAGRASSDMLMQQQTLNIVVRQRGVNFVAGHEAIYSNLGYQLLAEIVHAASGQSLHDYLAARIFTPLGMTRSLVHDDPTEIIKNRADSYVRKEKGGWQRGLLNYGIYGSTNIYTSIDDIAKWVGNLGHPVVGDAALIQQMMTSGTRTDGKPVNYGFGLWRLRFAGHDAVMHTGSDAGYHAILAYFPQQDLAIAIFSTVYVNRFDLMEAVTDIYLNNGNGSATKTPAAIMPLPGLLQAAVGHYMDPLGCMISLEMAGDKLQLLAGSGSHASPVIFRTDGSHDTGEERFWKYERFRTDKDGHVIAIEEVRDFLAKDPVIYSRITPVQPSAAFLAALCGDYRSDELDFTYRLTVEGGHLVARSIWTTTPLVLAPTVADRFDSDYGSIIFQRNATGRPTGLTLNMEAARNIKFDRVE